MDRNILIDYIDNALIEVSNLVEKSMFYKNDRKPIKSTRLILLLLKQEVEKETAEMNIRVLRAVHDLGMSSYKDFENTALEDAINNITGFLYKNLPGYGKLAPLRMDFGKGDPI